MRCPSCGSHQYDTEVICQNCGVLLSVTSEEMERVERYRLNANTEMLCVMFADVSGFSGIANRSLSLSQRILAVHMALSQAIIERDRVGEVVNTAGDGILAVFANPATATERALELHAAIHHYHQGLITDGYLADALRAAKLPLHPNIDDEEYKVHIGLHLGLVTRGGRTSRDVFGHNVNIACRLCSMADQGQTYMSEAVYDNARLILGGREDLEWQVWKEQPIRGLSEPMNLVGVGQQPYHAITPPRGMILPEPPKPAVFQRKPVMVGAIVLAMALAASLLIALLWPHPTTPPPPPPPPPRPDLTQGIFHTRIKVFEGSEVVKLDAPLPPREPPGPTSPPPYTDKSAIITEPIEGKEPSTSEDSPPDDKLPAPAPTFEDAADLEHFKPENLILEKAENIKFGETKAQLIAFKGKDAVVIAVEVNEPANPATVLSLSLDGDLDDEFNSEGPNFIDVLLSIGSPLNEGVRPRLQKLRDGKPGADFADMKGISARAFSLEKNTLWLFRFPLHQLQLSPMKDAQFRLEYALKGLEKPCAYYPGEKGFCQFEIPR